MSTLEDYYYLEDLKCLTGTRRTTPVCKGCLKMHCLTGMAGSIQWKDPAHVGVCGPCGETGAQFWVRRAPGLLSEFYFKIQDDWWANG